MTRRRLRTLLAAAAAVALLLPLPKSAVADGTPAEAGNVLFTIPDGWQRSDQGKVAILTPPGVPAGKTATLRIMPGEELTGDLRAWFDARWENAKQGATVVDGGEVQAQHVPAGYDIVLSYGELQDKAGKHTYMFLLAAQAKTRVESYCFTTDSLEVLQQNAAGLTAFAQSLMFKNLQPGAASPVPAPATPSPGPATPVAPPGGEAAVTLPPSISLQAPLWRSLINLRTHRLSEEFDELMASSPVPLSTPTKGPLTLPQAIANARARLNRGAPASAIAGLRNSPTARSVEGLQGAALAAIVAGKPAAALAALLIAYDKEPRNPSALVNLAGLLARMGMPNEALALLDAADKLGASLPAPVGLKGQAIALNNRGYALLLLRRWKEADATLRKAVTQEPQLPEAARNLAYVLNQEDEKEEAKRFFLLAVWRVRPQTLVCGGATSKSGDPPSDPYAKQGTDSLPSLGEMFDLSSGAPGRLPIIRHPTDVAQWDAFKKMIQKYEGLMHDRSGKRDQREEEIRVLLAQRPKSLTERRSRDIVSAFSMVGCQPDVRALYRQQCDAAEELRVKKVEIEASLKAQDEAISRKFSEQWKGKWSKGPAWDAAVEARRQQKLALGNEGITRVTPAWNHYEEIWRKRIALRRRYMSAMVAQLGDPLWHEKAMSFTVADGEMGFESEILMRMSSVYDEVSLVGRNAVKQQQPIEDSGEFAEEDSPCCGGHEAPTIAMAFGNALQVSLNCKSIGVEVGTEGPIGAFASAEYEFEGRVTVFAGPKAELAIPGVATKVGMKDGLYITVDGKGVQDVGARVVFETGHEIAPGVSMSSEIDSMKISFVPSVPGK